MVCVILLMGWGEAMQLWGSSWAQEPIETPICCQTDWKCLCRSRWSSWRWSPASMCVGCTISSVAPKATTHAGLPRLIDTCQSTLWFGRAHFPQTRRLPVARFVTFSRVAFLHAFAKQLCLHEMPLPTQTNLFRTICVRRLTYVSTGCVRISDLAVEVVVCFEHA